MKGYTALGTAPIRIADHLATGHDSAISQRALSDMLHLPRRTIRRMIEAERRAGALICSDNKQGYYLADGTGEARQFAQSMRSRAGEILRTAEAIEDALARVE